MLHAIRTVSRYRAKETHSILVQREIIGIYDSTRNDSLQREHKWKISRLRQMRKMTELGETLHYIATSLALTKAAGSLCEWRAVANVKGLYFMTQTIGSMQLSSQAGGLLQSKRPCSWTTLKWLSSQHTIQIIFIWKYQREMFRQVTPSRQK
jgi:hypothetical protein